MKKILLSALLLSTAFLNVAAQETGINSAFTRYGLGRISDGSLGFNKAMAGTGYAWYDGKQLNMTNPASYARLDSLTFLMDVAGTLQASRLTATGQHHSTSSRAYFDHVVGGFRVLPGLGVSFGLRPFTQVGYETKTNDVTLPNGFSNVTAIRTHIGEGGVHRAHLGLGYAPLRSLSLGVNASYLWGVTTHTATTSFTDATVPTPRVAYESEVRSLHFDFGAQYTACLNKKNTLTLGLTFAPSHALSGTSTVDNQIISNGQITSSNEHSLKDAYSLPATYGAGLMWQHNDRLRLAVDYTHQAWSKATQAEVVANNSNSKMSFTKSSANLRDLDKVSLGLEYVPAPQGYTWAGRVRYRLGASYATPYTLINGQKGADTFVATAGVGLPILTNYNNRSMLNISASYEQLRSQVGSSLTERNFLLTIGLTFNERWFKKWLVD
jgi:hypothetical protein